MVLVRKCPNWRQWQNFIEDHERTQDMYFPLNMIYSTPKDHPQRNGFLNHLVKGYKTLRYWFMISFIIIINLGKINII